MVARLLVCGTWYFFSYQGITGIPVPGSVFLRLVMVRVRVVSRWMYIRWCVYLARLMGDRFFYLCVCVYVRTRAMCFSLLAVVQCALLVASVRYYTYCIEQSDGPCV